MIRKKPVLGLDPGMETGFPKRDYALDKSHTRYGGYLIGPLIASRIATNPGFSASAFAAASILFIALTKTVIPSDPLRFAFLALRVCGV
jgi:hypothetical protein